MVKRSVAFEGVDVEASRTGDFVDFAFDLIAVRCMTGRMKVGGLRSLAPFDGLGLAQEGSTCPDHDAMVRTSALESAVNEYF